MKLQASAQGRTGKDGQVGAPPTELEHLPCCPCCGSTELLPFAVSQGLGIVKCANCTLVISNPRVPEHALRAFFNEEYISTEQRFNDELGTFRTPTLRREAALVRTLCPSGGRLLDVGTGSGAFLAEFTEDAAWSVEGIEPSRFAAEIAARRLGVRVHRGFVDEVALPCSSFDVVTILDTIFLDPQPERTLRTVAGYLKPGGYIVIEIPGFRFRMIKNNSVVSQLLFGERVRLNPGMQMFYFTERTLSRFLAKCGMHCVARDAEQGPVYGSRPVLLLNEAYFRCTRALYRLTGGRMHLAPKEVLVYRRSMM